MSTRRAKQLIYGALYILIIFLGIAIFYFIVIMPFTSGPIAVNCATNICTPTSTTEIATSSISIFVTSPGHYTFLAQAVDTNINFGAQALSYNMDLYDATGALIGSVPGQSFIYPSQSKYLVAPNIAIGGSVDHAALVITAVTWTASSTLGAIPQFIQQNIQTATSSNAIMVSGQLTNSSIGSYGKVIILALFNDGNGNVAGVSQTELDNIQPQSTNNFSVIYPAESGINAADNQIIIYALR